MHLREAQTGFVVRVVPALLLATCCAAGCNRIAPQSPPTASRSAPAVSANVTFASSIPPPTLNLNNGPATVLVGWLSPVDPPLTGTAQIGTLSVDIPAIAQPGTTYVVNVLRPSGTTDGSTNMVLSGVNGSITVGAAPGGSTNPHAESATPGIIAGNVNASPGATATVPISIAMPAGVQCATLQFNLTVEASGSTR